MRGMPEQRVPKDHPMQQMVSEALRSLADARLGADSTANPS